MQENQNIGRGYAGNVIAALVNLFIPGLGQLIQGRLMAAFLFFAFVALFWVLIVTWPIAVIVQIWSIYDAAVYKGK